MKRVIRLAALPLAGGLIAGTCDVNVTAPEMVGEWGGEHVMLTVSLTEGVLEYDCAHGSIDGRINPDLDGNFELAGVHVLEHGGPVREGEPPDEHPARYTGWTNGTRMTLTVTLTDTGMEIGTFHLRLGEQPRLYKCL